MNAIKKGYMGAEIPVTVNFDGPSRVEEQILSLSNSLAYYPEYEDKESSREFVELLSKIIPKFKHLNMKTLAAAIVFQKRNGDDIYDPTMIKFGEVMTIYTFNYKNEKNLAKYIAYKADILRYLTLLYDTEELDL